MNYHAVRLHLVTTQERRKNLFLKMRSLKIIICTFLFQIIHAPIMLNKCYDLKPEIDLKKYALLHNVDLISDANPSLNPRRSALFYELPNKQIIVLSGLDSTQSYGILYQDSKCFYEHIKNDYFPVENPIKSLYEYDKEKIKTINSAFVHYLDYFNKKYDTNFKSIDSLTLEAFIRHFNMENMQQMHDENLLALTLLLGEYFKRQLNGKWILIEQNGIYNPYFKPMFLLGGNLVVDIDKIAEMLSEKNLSAADIMMSLSIYFNKIVKGVELNIFDKVGIKYLLLE